MTEDSKLLVITTKFLNSHLHHTKDSMNMKSEDKLKFHSILISPELRLFHLDHI